VVAGAPILRIADAGAPIWVVAHIDETVAGGIRVGQPSKVVLRSQPGQSLPGRVARVEVESDRVTEEKAVDVTFALPAHVPPIGEQADVYVVTARKAKAPALPRKALVPLGKKFGVWLVRNGRVYLREVEVGLSDPSGWVEVLGGLAKGDKVAVAPPEVMTQLREGTRVSVR
jgi:HlyD family secretion protein